MLLKFHTGPICHSACVTDIPVIAATRVRTFECSEIFAEVYLRILFILDVTLHCWVGWSPHVAFIYQDSRSMKIATDPFLTFCRSLEPFKLLKMNLRCFFKMAKTYLLCSRVSHFRRTKSLSTFGFRGSITSQYILQNVIVLGFHSPYHFMMAPKVKG
jgi:hypothetical protein